MASPLLLDFDHFCSFLSQTTLARLPAGKYRPPISSYPRTWTDFCTAASRRCRILFVALDQLLQELIRHPLPTLNANVVVMKNLTLFPKRPKAISLLCQASSSAQPCFSSSPLVALRLQTPSIQIFPVLDN